MRAADRVTDAANQDTQPLEALFLKGFLAADFVDTGIIVLFSVRLRAENYNRNAADVAFVTGLAAKKAFRSRAM
ncbi:hypothetical protein [Aliiroseovarius sediminilitoris]|uniref:hypothetical protein n=1 Tax=Aliiroseovarius sediminilitoris TaxID=1173584 RepID=UPI00115FEA05|nr:hypothetical protein [Aliiroseovarius sediminilitoris]